MEGAGRVSAVGVTAASASSPSLRRADGCMPWMVIDDLVLDIGLFEDHPGGSNYLRLYYGRDASKAFHGGINLHTTAAETLMEMYAIARIEKGGVGGGGGGSGNGKGSEENERDGNEEDEDKKEK